MNERQHGWLNIGKGIAAAMVAFATVLGAAGAAGAADPEVKNLKISFGIDLPFAPHVIAFEKGWFEEAGFESVEPKTFTAGALAGEALLAGEIHIWQPSNWCTRCCIRLSVLRSGSAMPPK